MCAEKATQLQYQLRENAEELQDFMRDLANWEDAIKHKDLELSTKVDDTKILKNNIPPIRNRKSKENTSSKKKQKLKRLKAYDYKGWDKFDVDEACKAVDTSSEEEDEEEDEEKDETDNSYGDDFLHRARLVQQAVFEKDAGNDKFKLGLYEEAIEHYTRGIQCDPLNSILPANRAMALLKLERFAAAEVDCTTSLSLDPTYVKALCRRGAARQQLKKFAEAREDFLSALRIDPGNKQAKEEVKKLNKLLEMGGASLAKIQTASTSSAKSVMPGIVEPVNIPQQLRSKKALRRVLVEEIGNADTKIANHEEMTPPCEPLEQNIVFRRINEGQNEHMRQIELSHSGPAPDNIRDFGDFVMKPGRKVSLGKVRSNLISEDEPVEDVIDIVSGICTAQTNANAKTTTAPVSAKCDEKEILIPPAPKTPIQFQLDWRKLHHDSSALFKYFRNIEPKDYKRLFKEFLEADTLSSILSLLQDFYIVNDLDVALVLENLAKVSRFSTMIMFASDQDKQIIATLLSHIKEKYGTSTAEKIAAYYS